MYGSLRDLTEKLRAIPAKRNGRERLAPVHLHLPRTLRRLRPTTAGWNARTGILAAAYRRRNFENPMGSNFLKHFGLRSFNGRYEQRDRADGLGIYHWPTPEFEIAVYCEQRGIPMGQRCPQSNANVCVMYISWSATAPWPLRGPMLLLEKLLSVSMALHCCLYNVGRTRFMACCQMNSLRELFPRSHENFKGAPHCCTVTFETNRSFRAIRSNLVPTARYTSHIYIFQEGKEHRRVSTVLKCWSDRQSPNWKQTWRDRDGIKSIYRYIC